MNSPRPSRVVEVVREGIPFATPTILLVTGAFLFGFNSHAENLLIPAKELSAVLDLKGMEANQSLSPSLVHDAFFRQQNVAVLNVQAVQKPFQA